MSRTRTAVASQAAAQNAAPAALEPAPAAQAEPTYFEITLGRAVSFYGKHYAPAYRHVVDQATLELMGDAVVEKKRLG